MAREVPVTPRKEPRQPRARATVDAILLAAAHILKTEGFERATTNRIAERAGVSIGSLYQYFPNKQAVVAALRERHHDWFKGCIEAEIARVASLPLRKAVRSAVELSIALHAVDVPLHNALTDRHGPAPHDDAALRRLAQRELEENRSELRPLDPETAAFILVRTQQALIHRTAHDEPERLSDPRFAEEVTELLARYLEP